MLFNSQYILLILFINLKTTLDGLHQVSKFGVPPMITKRFNKEFKRFQGHSDEAKEFEDRYYNAIKNCFSISSKVVANDEVTEARELIDLLKGSKVFLNGHKKLNALEKKCSGHYCEANSEELLNKSRKNYQEDLSIEFVGNNIVKYTEVNGGEVVTGTLSTTFLVGWTIAAATGPVGWASAVFGSIGSALVGLGVKKTKESMTPKLNRCDFQYWHKSDCLDKCSDIVKAFSLFSTEGLLNVINEIIDIVDRYINNEIIFKNFEKYIREIECELSKSNSDLKSLADKILKAKEIINDIDDEELNEENIIKFADLKKLLNVLSNSVKNLNIVDEASDDKTGDNG